MNFFRHQEQARQRSRWLLALFILVVALVVTVVSLLLAGLTWWLAGFPALYDPDTLALTAVWLQFPWWPVAASIASLIVLTSLFRWQELRREGGALVARRLGGSPLSFASCVPASLERRLLNVVEEMAIAAGMPVPTVYLLEQPGINAFAAGYGWDDAVIGVTRGALERLDRTQLQGVIAHEFSHILQGDMRLNMRLLAMLAGLVAVGQLGSWLSEAETVRRSRRRDDRSAGGVVVLGWGLMAIGALGVGAGRLLQAAIGRQREFLADAGAVQLTRDPSGLANALKRVAETAAPLQSPWAGELRHLLFSDGRARVRRWLATHPPLRERIYRLDPHWDGQWLAPQRPTKPLEDKPATPMATVEPVLAVAAGAVLPQAPLAIESPMQQAVHDPDQVAALLTALLIVQEQDTRAAWQWLRQHAPAQHAAVWQQARTLLSLSRAQRFQLRLQALPVLKRLDLATYQQWRTLWCRLIVADGRQSFAEWLWIQWLLHSLDPHFLGRHRVPKAHRLRQLDLEISELFSLFLALGKEPGARQQERLSQALFLVGLNGSWLSAQQIDLGRLGRGLTALRGLAPLEKQRVLQAMTRCLDCGHDAQQEFLQSLALWLECPAQAA